MKNSPAGRAADFIEFLASEYVWQRIIQHEVLYTELGVKAIFEAHGYLGSRTGVPAGDVVPFPPYPNGSPTGRQFWYAQGTTRDQIKSKVEAFNPNNYTENELARYR